MKAKFTHDTFLKQDVLPAARLAENHKHFIKSGTELEITKHSADVAQHRSITFKEPIGGYQTWLAFDEHVDCPGEKVKIELKVPYFSQRDNQEQWWRTCSTSSHAMLLKYLKPQAIAGDDDYFQRFVKPVGDSTDWGVHTAALAKFGIVSRYFQNLGFDDLINSLKRGFPVVIGVLHHGPVHAPTGGGHVLLITGVDEDKQVFIANDPWGVAFSYASHNGRSIEIPFYPSLDRRWQVDGTHTGWGRLVQSVDGKTSL
ncbi:hypothetical protein OsccyDRAFT_0586 [Leptolyngbyaceae cyanobacterium JSC-12]|nr:hypothetical protein OsccyDRAFT_0586 [Leptolyngbyaceae cyanobacterium JSC-12]